MARKVVLDTGVIVGLHRGVISAAQAHQPTDELAIAALTAAELLVGAELASPEWEPVRRQRVERSLGDLYVLDYDLRVARVHALLMADARRTGQPRGDHDLIIAATALAHRRVLITTDSKARFADLPGLDVEVVGAS
jgi:tRNA(fMet)-specific endonuclease VapC